MMGRRPVSRILSRLTFKGQALDHKGSQDEEKACHEDLHNALDACLQAKPADHKAKAHTKGHAEDHGFRRGQGCGKEVLHARGAHAGKGACCHVPAVEQKPACDHGVEHEQKIAAHKGDPAEFVPVRALWLKDAEGAAKVFLRGPAYGKFRDHDGDDGKHAQKEDDHEPGAAVGSGYVGKTPDIAKTYGASCRNQYEAHARAETFPCHYFCPPRKKMSPECGGQIV